MRPDLPIPKHEHQQLGPGQIKNGNRGSTNWGGGRDGWGHGWQTKQSGVGGRGRRAISTLSPIASGRGGRSRRSRRRGGRKSGPHVDVLVWREGDLRRDDRLRDEGLGQSMPALEVRRGDDAHESGTEGMGRRGDDAHESGTEGMGRRGDDAHTGRSGGRLGCVTCGAGPAVRERAEGASDPTCQCWAGTDPEAHDVRARCWTGAGPPDVRATE
jgi:hypothetical protein